MVIIGFFVQVIPIATRKVNEIPSIPYTYYERYFKYYIFYLPFVKPIIFYRTLLHGYLLFNLI